VRQFSRAVPSALTSLTLSGREPIPLDAALAIRDTPSRETHWGDGCDAGELGDAIAAGFAPMGRASVDGWNSAGAGSCARAGLGRAIPAAVAAIAAVAKAAQPIHGANEDRSVVDE
jgi:nucleoid-associated protein YgaU